MYQLYIANKNYSSWSLRPWVLMRTLGITFDERLQVFAEADNFGAFRSFAPNGKVPCLQAGEQVVWDSLGIVEYLAEAHPGVWPTDRTARTWARCATAEMHAGFTALRNDCPMNCGITAHLNAISPALQRDLDRIEELWCEGLQTFGGPFLAGDTFTAVDAFFAPVVFRLSTYEFSINATASDYAARMLALPAMQDWLTEALREPWREVQHEQEILAAGRIVEDRRVAPNS